MIEVERLAVLIGDVLKKTTLIHDVHEIKRRSSINSGTVKVTSENMFCDCNIAPKLRDSRRATCSLNRSASDL